MMMRVLGVRLRLIADATTMCAWFLDPRSNRRERWRLRRKARRARGHAEISVDATRDAGFRARQHHRVLALTSESLENFRADCRTLREQCGGEGFFMSRVEAARLEREPDDVPAVLLYVAQCLRRLSRLPAVGESSERAEAGAEFWVQSRRAGEPINWHWDKDEQLRDAHGVVVHPLLSTVTYLTTGGAPTVLFDIRVGTDGELEVPKRGEGGVRRVAALVSHPRASKMLVFNGRLLHGCPPELAEPSDDADSAERLTLLINIWRGHRPVGVPRFPRKLWREMGCREPQPLDPDALSAAAARAPPRAATMRMADGVPSSTLRMPVCGTHELRARMPRPSRSGVRHPEYSTLRCFGVPVRCARRCDDGD